MSTIDINNTIAKRVSRLLEENWVVNLGIGIPTLVANHTDKSRGIVFHSENGILGMGSQIENGVGDSDHYNAGSQYVEVEPGAVFLDSALTFGLVRGGHVNATILGSLQVDEKGNISNWIIPGHMIAGIGGAVDLVSGAKMVILAMAHANKGRPKILKNCTFPLTGAACVNYIVTEMGLMEITPEGIVLREIANGVSISEVQAVTEAELIITDDLAIMEVVTL